MKALYDRPGTLRVDGSRVRRTTGARGLHARGIGWVDAHLLAAALALLTGCGLWTRDGSLRAAALHVRLAAPGR